LLLRPVKKYDLLYNNTGRTKYYYDIMIVGYLHSNNIVTRHCAAQTDSAVPMNLLTYVYEKWQLLLLYYIPIS